MTLSWREAGKRLSGPRLEDRHLEAGIGYNPSLLYHLYFNAKRKGEWRWFSRSGFETADEALEYYNKILDAGWTVID